MQELSSKSITIIMLTALLLLVTIQTQNVGVMAYTRNELEQCYALLPSGYVIDASGQTYDENGVLTTLTCGDYLSSVATTTGNMTGEFYGNATNMSDYTTGNMLTNVSSIPAGEIIGNIDGIPTAGFAGNMTGGMIGNINMDTQIPTLDSNLVSPETLQEFGVFLGPIQKHTGVYHNENGVFIPWKTLCNSGQDYLLQSCNSLINPDGRLTSAGNKAVECVTNGAILTALGGAFNLPLDSIKGILGALATPTGCGGIVDLNSIQNTPDIQRLVQFAGSMAQ